MTASCPTRSLKAPVKVDSSARSQSNIYMEGKIMHGQMAAMPPSFEQPTSMRVGLVRRLSFGASDREYERLHFAQRSLRLCLAVPSTEHVQPKFKESKAIKSSHSATVPRKNKCFPDIRITKYPTKSKVGQLATMLQNRRTQRGANAKMKWF
jgi:hypothetical protein